MALLFPKPGPRKKEGRPSFPYHNDLVRSTPCAACLMLGRISEGRSHGHHLKEGQGTSCKASDFEQIPLCGMHHTDGPKGVSYHEDPGSWPWDQRDLLARCWAVWKLIGKIPKNTPVGEQYLPPPPRSMSSFLPDQKLIRLFGTLAPHPSSQPA